jgi:hypothetical protein
LTERPRATSIAAVAKQITNAASTLITADVTSIRKAKAPWGARVRKIAMGRLVKPIFTM